MVTIMDLGDAFEEKLAAGGFLRPEAVLRFESFDEATVFRQKQPDSRRYSYPIFHRDGETTEITYEQRSMDL